MSDPITVVDVTGTQVPLEADWGVQAQRAAEDHMSRVWAHFHGEEDDEDPTMLVSSGDSPAVGAFDGCATCEVRETLHAAMPFIEAGLVGESTYEKASRPLVFNLIACPQEPADG